MGTEDVSHITNEAKRGEVGRKAEVEPLRV
jgi:hypothetical protein